jgi:50S ribosomal protein L16 3-hydroxylase
MLCHAGWIFVNGEAFEAGKDDYALLRELADQRELPAGADIPDACAELLYQWYLDGYLTPR